MKITTQIVGYNEKWILISAPSLIQQTEVESHRISILSQSI